MRKYRLTASNFGEVFNRKPDTPPDALALRLLQQHQISSPAIEWGIQQEPKAIEVYKQYQHSIGHDSLSVCRLGFLICRTQPFLGASPDGGVYDPSSNLNPFGLLEVKCPYRHRDQTPIEACSDSSFCCNVSLKAVS